MPGRQSTGPAVGKSPGKKPNSSHKTKKRSLNALAVAEQQNPHRPKIRKHRLGEIDRGDLKRNRDESKDGSDADEERAQNSKRIKARQKDRFGNEIEVGSDSDGNEWTIGQVDEDEDSDLDSDEAMGESDEERFEGFTFGGSSSAMSGKKKKSKKSRDDGGGGDVTQEIDLNEGTDENNDQDGSDDLGEDAIDLAAMLDDNNEDDEIVRNVDVEEGIPIEEHFDSDDDDSTDNEDSTISFSDADDETNDPSKLSALQNLVSSIGASDRLSKNTRRPLDAVQEAIAPSEYGLMPRQKVTVADLLPTITDPHLRKSLKLMINNGKQPAKTSGGIPQKLDVPLAKRQQDRLDRAAAYEKSKETLDRWIDTVKHNRRAEHLSFPLQDPDRESAKKNKRLLPITQSKPITSLESTIQNILVESGLAPQDSKSQEDQIQEFEELATNKLPIGEVQARRAELRRARELLFREEIRSKRIKKIKSKSYRRVHRKQRERDTRREQELGLSGTAGEGDVEDEEELADRLRAEERMGARHRESKWAKGVKGTGRAAWDEDTRDGVLEMAKRGEELRRRIEGKDVRVDESLGSSDSSEDDGLSASDDADDGTNRLREKLNRLGSTKQGILRGPGSALSSMKFMQKAEASRKAQNDADVERMRHELDDKNSSEESDSARILGRRAYGPKPERANNTASKASNLVNEFEERLNSEDEESGGFALREKPTTKGHTGKLNGLGQKESLEKHSHLAQFKSNGSASGKQKEPLVTNGSEMSSSIERSAKEQREFDNSWVAKMYRETFGGNAEKLLENPWHHIEKPKKKNKFARNTADDFLLPNNGEMMPLPEATQTTSALHNQQAKHASRSSTPSDASFEGLPSLEPSVLEQTWPDNETLVRQYFAGDDVTSAFNAEKKATVNAEDDQVIEDSLPGWGSWTGDGLPKRIVRQNKRNRTFTIQEGIKPEKRADAKLDRVIINEKRIKKNEKYLASQLPHPFETKAQYERSLRLPVGPEWTTKETFQVATMPRILLKQGIIAPMEKPQL